MKITIENEIRVLLVKKPLYLVSYENKIKNHYDKYFVLNNIEINKIINNFLNCLNKLLE